MHPILLDGSIISENSGITLGVIVALSPLIVATCRALWQGTSTAKLALATAVEVKQEHGEKLDKLVETSAEQARNTGEMTVELKHLTEKLNGAVSRTEFLSFKDEVTRRQGETERRLERIEGRGGE